MKLSSSVDTIFLFTRFSQIFEISSFNGKESSLGTAAKVARFWYLSEGLVNSSSACCRQVRFFERDEYASVQPSCVTADFGTKDVFLLNFHAAQHLFWDDERT
jgi:hypothetical protein